MPVTLAEAQVNAQNDVDYAVIDATRRNSWLLDQIVFDDTATPGTGGASLGYSYTRLVTPRSAGFRAFNAEYAPSKATRQRYSVELHPLGGTFDVDRVLAGLGPAQSNEVNFQMSQLIVSTRTRFQEEVIRGDIAADPDGFDGLDKALTGSSTEVNTGTHADWTQAAITDQNTAHDALDLLDEFLSLIQPSQTGGLTSNPDSLPPGVKAILGNNTSITRVRSIARRAGMYTATKDDLGRMIEAYGDWVLVDIGDTSDASEPIIPIETRDPDGDTTTTSGLTDLYAVTFGMDSFHAASVAGKPVMQTWLPDFDRAGAVKLGEAEMGPLAGVLRNTKSAAVLRNIKVK